MTIDFLHNENSKYILKGGFPIGVKTKIRYLIFVVIIIFSYNNFFTNPTFKNPLKIPLLI